MNRNATMLASETTPSLQVGPRLGMASSRILSSVFLPAHTGSLEANICSRRGTRSSVERDSGAITVMKGGLAILPA